MIEVIPGMSVPVHDPRGDSDQDLGVFNDFTIPYIYITNFSHFSSPSFPSSTPPPGSSSQHDPMVSLPGVCGSVGFISSLSECGREIIQRNKGSLSIFMPPKKVTLLP